MGLGEGGRRESRKEDNGPHDGLNDTAEILCPISCSLGGVEARLKQATPRKRVAGFRDQVGKATVAA